MNAIATRRRSPAISGVSRRSAEPMVRRCSWGAALLSV
jgi:hypothetical protein